MYTPFRQLDGNWIIIGPDEKTYNLQFQDNELACRDTAKALNMVVDGSARMTTALNAPCVDKSHVHSTEK